MKLDAMKMSNFVLGDRVVERDTEDGVPPNKANYRLRTALMAEVISTLAHDKPLWMFVAESAYKQNIHDVNVFQDGEMLGTISTSYYRGSDCVTVDNDRIRAKRERGGAYRTSIAAKAVNETKKLFMRKSTNELLKAAQEEAVSVVTEQKRVRDYEVRRSCTTIENAMLTYVRDTQEGYKHFIQHLQATHKTQVINSIEKTRELKEELDAIKRFEGVGTENAALVVRTNGVYIVKMGEHVTFMTDDELPMDYRAKLGMLKLVGDKNFITDCGSRINENTFVIAVDPTPNSVSQEGE